MGGWASEGAGGWVSGCPKIADFRTRADDLRIEYSHVLVSDTTHESELVRACVRAFVRACVRACMGACVRACVRACVVWSPLAAGVRVCWRRACLCPRCSMCACDSVSVR